MVQIRNTVLVLALQVTIAEPSYWLSCLQPIPGGTWDVVAGSGVGGGGCTGKKNQSQFYDDSP